jgi:heme-degrading monooxygenase HmoA
MWRAKSTLENSHRYIRHATETVFPALRAIEGHRGAYLLRHERGDTVDLVVLTLWESMNAVQKFAGTEPSRAIVEPEAQAVLTSFDDFATHFDVVHHSIEVS